jgi:hypothetical protein
LIYTIKGQNKFFVLRAQSPLPIFTTIPGNSHKKPSYSMQCYFALVATSGPSKPFLFYSLLGKTTNANLATISFSLLVAVSCVCCKLGLVMKYAL